MENNNFTRWCQTATEQIRYKPDRKAVSEELMGHLEDAYDTCIAKGLTPAEAQQKVLANMGSAEEIAPQLGSIHRPFLGRFCKIVSVLAVIVLVFELFGVMLLVWIGQSITNESEFEKPVGYVAPYFSKQESETGRRIYYAKPKPRARANGYTIYAKRLSIWEYADHNTIYLEIAVNHGLFVGDLNQHNLFSVYDNNGNTLGMWVYESTNGATTQTNIWRTNYSPDQTIEWIEIRCTRDGEDVILLHIDVNGGEGV